MQLKVNTKTECAKKAASVHSILFGKVASTDVVLRKDVGSTLVANDVSGCYATGYALNAYAYDNLVKMYDSRFIWNWKFIT